MVNILLNIDRLGFISFVCSFKILSIYVSPGEKRETGSGFIFNIIFIYLLALLLFFFRCSLNFSASLKS